MIRKAIVLAPVLLVSHLASAQAPVIEQTSISMVQPITAYVQEQLSAVENMLDIVQQQFPVLNNVPGSQHCKVTALTAVTTLPFAATVAGSQDGMADGDIAVVPLDHPTMSLPMSQPGPSSR